MLVSLMAAELMQSKERGDAEASLATHVIILTGDNLQP